jgi:hypothetical protein
MEVDGGEGVPKKRGPPGEDEGIFPASDSSTGQLCCFCDGPMPQSSCERRGAKEYRKLSLIAAGSGKRSRVGSEESQDKTPWSEASSCAESTPSVSEHGSRATSVECVRPGGRSSSVPEGGISAKAWLEGSSPAPKASEPRAKSASQWPGWQDWSGSAEWCGSTSETRRLKHGQGRQSGGEEDPSRNCSPESTQPPYPCSSYGCSGGYVEDPHAPPARASSVPAGSSTDQAIAKRMPKRRTESESFAPSSARRSSPEGQSPVAQVVSTQDSTPRNPDKFMYLKDKRAAIREGGIKDGLGKRLDRFGTWKSFVKLVAAAKEEQGGVPDGRWGGSSTEECQLPNLHDDLSYQDDDVKSKRYYRQLGQSYMTKSRAEHPRFVAIPCNSTWKSKLLDTYVKMGPGSPLEKTRSYVQWNFNYDNEEWKAVNALSYLMSKWLRHGNLSRRKVETGRGSNEALRIDEQGWVPMEHLVSLLESQTGASKPSMLWGATQS